MVPKTLCRRCGAYLSVPSGARTVTCPLCRTVTPVERRPHGLHHAAVGFIKGLISSIVSPGPGAQQPPLHLSSSSSLRPGDSGGSRLPASYPRARGCKKRALLVGISYAGTTKYELKGTVNDVNCMSFMLRQRFNFPSECILVMTQEDKDPNKVPTKYNLRQAMRWLVDGASYGDSLVFHFSGHGVQKLDTNGDEVDGYDEAICPMDFEYSGVILDDEVNATIVRPLGPGVTLHAIVDTCHSGTILDLPYLCRISRTGYWQWENHSRPSGEPKGTNGGLAISISGCSDSQTSEDTTVLSGSISTGAMTYSFIKAVESEPGTTYGRLLTAMRATIRDNGGEFGIPGPIGTFFRRVITFSCAQEPQLCASEPFDIYRKQFAL
ncbi:hypothetical protein PR202_gn00029 [Eleusine coracana subsp. coracana]|uniref:Uncharacterized protein n=1 Tax=Eleusine coracana subsp. coracana TaxID=191504 RepID=A0AAV5G113_ELECO|nr:hypothetical protein QOZ80_3BG0277500 [Eleusine coracana subsp. coracana]GJN31671.1 hypothetical protein PR202_gb20095 [Eleusine coracana subsp. coracana]GJN40733.1 hypothetical protein PR202_gn00029 [Eleusine coracana subsp. coracana]